jgi:hypothetical protein
VSILTVCADFTRSTGARSAAIQPQLTVAGVEGSITWVAALSTRSVMISLRRVTPL